MDVYTLSISDAQRFAQTLEKMRATHTFNECIGIGPGDRETNSLKSYVYPYREYGTVHEATLLASGNALSLMLRYDQIRLSYALQAKDNWRQVDFDAFGGTYSDMPYSSNLLTSESISKIISLFDGKFRIGDNNLYNVLGGMASDIYFLGRFIQNLYLHQH